jgi:hypothetical protein
MQHCLHFLKTIFRYKQIQRNNKIRLNKKLITPLFQFGSINWTVKQMSEDRLHVFQMKILRSM